MLILWMQVSYQNKLTFGFPFSKEGLCDLYKQGLGRVGGVQLWHHHTAAGWEFIRCVSLEKSALLAKLIEIPIDRRRRWQSE